MTYKTGMEVKKNQLILSKQTKRPCFFCKKETAFLKSYGFCKCKSKLYIAKYQKKYKRPPVFGSFDYLVFCNRYYWAAFCLRKAQAKIDRMEKRKEIGKKISESKGAIGQRSRAPKTLIRKRITNKSPTV